MQENPMAIHYSISAPAPQTHEFCVTIKIDRPDPGGQRCWLPDWIPGSYLIRDFARHIGRVSASSDGTAVACEKTGKSEWLCSPVSGTLELRYTVYALDLSVRGAYLDTERGFFNGTSVFLAVAGQEQDPCTVTIQAPAGEQYHDWRLATSMARAGATELGFGDYRAQDYDELIDHPVEMGSFDLAHFEVLGVPHYFVLSGRHRADLQRICADLKRICETHAELFGGRLPMDRYWFLTLALGDAYGGLEHRASTALVCKRDDLVPSGAADTDKAYRKFMGLCSHEYFHSWNVKRIKPQAFTPYRLDRENYTRLLWVFEGITSYYDDLGLVRSGVITPAAYLDSLAQTITRVLQGPGRKRQSLAESSFDAWTKFYKQDENSPNSIVSYYAKGALAALALDLTMRQNSAGKCSLDQVMKESWRRYGQTGLGMPEDAFESLVQQVSGLELSSFFDLAIRGTEDLPLQSLLDSVGVELRLRAASSSSDLGGGSAAKSSTIRRVSLGLRTRDENGRCRVATVLDGGPAQEAGVSPGDELLAVDRLKVSHATLDAVRARLPAGVPVVLHVFRRDELMQLVCTPCEPAPEVCELSIDHACTPEVARAREDWLGRQANRT